ATGCVIDLGFVRAWAVCNDETSEAGHGDLRDREQLRQKVLALTEQKAEDCDFSQMELTVRGMSVGYVIFAIRKDRDPLTRPSLLDNSHLQTVASLLADVVLDTAYAQFAGALTDLQVKLNLSGANSVESWFDMTDAVARGVGLTWVVSSLPDKEGRRFYGSEGDVELVRDLEASLSESVWVNGPVCLSLPEATDKAHHVVGLFLRHSGAYLWLGVGRKTFGLELLSSSPWRDFLESFAQATDSALVCIERHRLQLEAKQLESDRYRLQHEAKQMENFTIRVETRGLLMHTLGNDATALLQGTERLVEVLPEVGQKVTEELRNQALSLKESTQNVQSLSMAFRQPVPTDTRSRILLMDAVNRIMMIHRDSFNAKNVRLEVSIPSDLAVGVPLDVAYIVLITLMVNSSEAIGKDGGIIKISANNGGGQVICSVEDTGCGINSEDVERLFEPGYSTKENGTGLGLWLARKSLRRYDGDLQLASSEPGATKFTLYFSA
ncbi:MAG TPA: HAMP domain-containing sensor histidine kinase, partial [Thermoanaerobaculia bacterium]|nr:HAMP domain-containing sensor histidine kinase [Thermoanaerobaculia bacterium]